MPSAASQRIRKPSVARMPLKLPVRRRPAQRPRLLEKAVVPPRVSVRSIPHADPPHCRFRLPVWRGPVHRVSRRFPAALLRQVEGQENRAQEEAPARNPVAAAHRFRPPFRGYLPLMRAVRCRLRSRIPLRLRRSRSACVLRSSSVFRLRLVPPCPPAYGRPRSDPKSRTRRGRGRKECGLSV